MNRFSNRVSHPRNAYASYSKNWAPASSNSVSKLQDQVAPIPFSDVESVIQRETGRPLKDIFADIDTTSLAAASVGQVHAARLFTGEKVAVKIIRPGIDRKIREDIRLMYYMAEKIERAFEVGRIIGAVNLVREFERIIFRELDMLIEAGSIEKFAYNFKDVEEIYIPRVYWEYTTRSVLVMEHIEGIKMDQVETIRAHGIDPKEIAMIGLRSFSRQLMKFGFFHADPHPGNTIVMYDGRVALVDFGITGYLDEEMMRQIANLFLGYAEHDYDMVMDALMDAGLIDEETMDLKAFRTDLKDMSEAFYGRSLQNISVRDVYDQVMQLVLKYHIRLPRNLLLLLKTFIQTEALGKILGSDASILEVTRPFARELLQKGYDARSLFKNVGRDARITGKYVKAMPKLVHDILKQTAGGRQKVELVHSGLEPLNSNVEKGVNRITMGLIISASLLAAAMVLNSSLELFRPRCFAHRRLRTRGLHCRDLSGNLAGPIHSEIRQTVEQRIEAAGELPGASSPFLFLSHRSKTTWASPCPFMESSISFLPGSLSKRFSFFAYCAELGNKERRRKRCR